MNKITYIILLLSSFIFADSDPIRMTLEAQTLIEYRHLSEQKESCMLNKNINELCVENKITYPELSSINDKSLVNLIRDDIKEMIKEFKSVDVHNELKKMDMVESRDMKLYKHNSYNIFSFTPKTLTIEVSSSFYEGGTHGYYGIWFKNIDKSSKKELKLGDILKPNSQKAFTHTVERLYREMRHLSKTETLKDAGWFDDKFELAQNFAITPQGLYFLYNIYEIQPYSMRQEVILVPYSKIKEFLSEKYFNNSTLKEIDTLAHTYKKTFNNSLKIAVKPMGNHTIKVTVESVNRDFETTKGWLSVSFKELKSKNVKVTLLNQNFDKFQSYFAGSKIYNSKKKKVITSDYLLVEAEAKKWKSEELKKLEFELTAPKNVKHLTVLVRAVHKFNKRIIGVESKNKDSLVTGQQGENNFMLNIEL